MLYVRLCLHGAFEVSVLGFTHALLQKNMFGCAPLVPHVRLAPVLRVRSFSSCLAPDVAYSLRGADTLSPPPPTADNG